MRLATCKTCCDICGEEGVAAPQDAANQWLGGIIRHSDPEVCAVNLKRKRKKFEKREEELLEKEE